MRKRAIFLFTILATLIISGCGKDLKLIDNPIEFNTSTFINPSNEEDTYSAIEYNGRSYVLYGTLKGTMKDSEISECIGYIVQDGVKIEDTMVCLLDQDTQSNYLVEIDTVGFMSQPVFLRAIDTAGKDIPTPKFIDSLDYEFWQ